MDNYASIFVALLEHLGHLTAKQAEKIAAELHSSTLPGTYKEASKFVKELFDKAEVSIIDKNLSDIKSELTTKK